jgi:hypothetical protein
MTNTLNQIFFSSTKIRIFFQQHIFLEKTIPAPPFKLNGRSLTAFDVVMHSHLMRRMPCWNSGQTLVTNQQYAPEG